MNRISIVFHSGFGHTKVVADHMKVGAEPNAADRKSAERLGQRIAAATARWARVY